MGRHSNQKILYGTHQGLRIAKPFNSFPFRQSQRVHTTLREIFLSPSKKYTNKYKRSKRFQLEKDGTTAQHVTLYGRYYSSFQSQSSLFFLQVDQCWLKLAVVAGHYILVCMYVTVCALRLLPFGVHVSFFSPVEPIRTNLLSIENVQAKRKRTALSFQNGEPTKKKKKGEGKYENIKLKGRGKTCDGVCNVLKTRGGEWGRNEEAAIDNGNCFVIQDPGVYTRPGRGGQQHLLKIQF